VAACPAPQPLDLLLDEVDSWKEKLDLLLVRSTTGLEELEPQGSATKQTIRGAKAAGSRSGVKLELERRGAGSEQCQTHPTGDGD
jgi:hypothetical protein